MEERQEAPVKKDSFAALRYKDFRAYVGMRFFFTLAYQMQAVVIGFYIYQITHSKLALGYIGLCEAIPAISIALYGGYIADKYEKRKLLFIIFSVVLFASLTIFTVTLQSMSHLVHTGWVVPIIYVMIFLNGVARAFYGPATFAIYAQSIPKELYPNGSTWSSSSWQIATILGPAAGGLIFGNFGITPTFIVINILLLVSLLLVYMLRSYPPVYIPKENIWQSLSAGINFVFKNKMMLGAMSLDLFSVFFGGAIALLPVFAHDILKVGSEGLGIMRATSSLGAVLTMLAMTRFSPMNRPWRNLLIAVTGLACLSCALAYLKVFTSRWFSCLPRVLLIVFSVIIRSTLMQLLTPDEMRGRVSAVNSMFIGSSNEIGAFESGSTAELMGTVPSVIFGGCMTLLVVTVTFLKTRNLIPAKLSDISSPSEKVV